MHEHASLFLAAVILYLATLPLIGCSPRRLPAYGAANEMTIVTNLGTQDEAVVLLRSVLSKPLISVDEDTLYIPEILSGAEFARHDRSYDAYRNLVMLVDITRNDGLTKKVEELLGTNVLKRIQEGSAEYFVRSDVWALGQTLTIIAGADNERLVTLIKGEGRNLYAELDSLVTEKTEEVIFAGGEQSLISKDLASKYGWSLRVPLGFKPVELDTVETGMLLRFRIDEPTRLLFVYWMPYQGNVGEVLDPRKCMDLRAKLVWSVYDQDVMDLTKTVAKEAVFEGRRAVRIDGVWQNEKYVIGGPFFTYCFLTANRFYLIDAVVYAPGARKGALLKQLEAMMRTFRG